jgi:hypothetical protein
MPGLREIALNSGDKVKSLSSQMLDFNRVFKVLELTDGRVYVETEHTDPDTGITTIEVLMSRNRKTFCIIQRHRFGDNYDRMQSFDRDTKYPLYCQVNL